MEGKKATITIYAQHLAGSGPGQPDPEKIRLAVEAAKEKALGRTKPKHRKRSGDAK